MEFFDVIKKRTSISKYKDSKISKESIDKMIEAAMRAPSWKNRSAFRVVIVDDKDKKDEIAESIRNKDDKACNAVKEAPIAMVIIAKPDDSGEVEGKGFYLVDGAIAAIDEGEVKDILKIPDEYKIIGITPVGEIAEEKEHYKAKDIKEFAFRNEYNNPY